MPGRPLICTYRGFAANVTFISVLFQRPPPKEGVKAVVECIKGAGIENIGLSTN
jgi:hypothetical protein